MHERQTIRDAVVAQLIGPSPYVRTSAGQRVFKTRTGPVRESDLPCICVFVAGETVTSQRLQSQERECAVTVECYVKAAPSADLDAALDDLALQVETAWDLDEFLGSAVRSSALSSTELETSMLGAQPMGRAALKYVCTYTTPFRGPPALDAFVTADVRTSVAGAQALADQSHDVVTIPQ